MMEYSYNIYISNHFILMYTTKSVGSVRLFIYYINFEKKIILEKEQEQQIQLCCLPLSR